MTNKSDKKTSFFYITSLLGKAGPDSCFQTPLSLSFTAGTKIYDTYLFFSSFLVSVFTLVVENGFIQLWKKPINLCVRWAERAPREGGRWGGGEISVFVVQISHADYVPSR